MTAADQSDDEPRPTGLPQVPSLADEPPPRIDPPKPVQVSCWLWIVAAIVFVVGYAIMFGYRQTLVDQAVRSNTNQAVTAGQISSGMTTMLAVLLIGAVCFGVLFALFAYKARQGTRSARSVLAGLMVITLLFQLVLPFATIITLVATLIGLVALALLFLPKTTTYFPKAKRKVSASG